MAGLSWIEVAVDLPRQDKSILLGRKIGEPTRGWVYRAALWLWAADQCPEGRVTRDSRVSPDADEAVSLLEFGMGWSGAPCRLFNACVECRVIDVTPDAYVIHGWAEYAAAHVAKRRKDAERQRKRRAELAKRYASSGTPAGVTRDTGGRPGESRSNKNKNTEKKEAAAAARARAREAASEAQATGTALPGAPTAAPGLNPAPPPAGHSAEGGSLAAVAGESDLPRRRLQVLDLVELGPLGAAYRSAVEQGLGYGLALAAAGEEGEIRAELEAQLVRVGGEDGLARAVSWTLATAESRGPTRRPGSVAWCVKLLRSLPPPARAAPASDRGCAEWARVFEALRAQVRPDLVASWFAPLRGRLEDGELVLEAPDAFHAAFVRDQYRAFVEDVACEVLGGHLAVRVEAAVGEKQRAAGGVG